MDVGMYFVKHFINNKTMIGKNVQLFKVKTYYVHRTCRISKYRLYMFKEGWSNNRINHNVRYR